MVIDIFNHVLPPAYLERLKAVSDERGDKTYRRQLPIKPLYDLDARLRVLAEFGDDYRQIICLGSPPIEAVAGPELSPELARLANDGMSEFCRQSRGRLPSFAASLPMDNPPAAMREIERAVGKLGAKAIQIFSNVAGKALDEPELFPIFERMAALDLPILMHPARGPSFADYRSESRSKYGMWWSLGWPYETSIAMARLCLAGIFERLPSLKIVTHHMGGMIPYFEGRIGPELGHFEAREADPDYAAVPKSIARNPLEHLRKFYADTALFGAAAATRCGLEFFGVDHCLFATDCPFDSVGGSDFIRKTLQVVDGLGLKPADREKLLSGNARRLFRLEL